MINQIYKIGFFGIFNVKPYKMEYMLEKFNLDETLHHHNNGDIVQFKVDPTTSMCGGIHESVLQSLFNTTFNVI